MGIKLFCTDILSNHVAQIVNKINGEGKFALIENTDAQIIGIAGLQLNSSTFNAGCLKRSIVLACAQLAPRNHDELGLRKRRNRTDMYRLCLRMG